MGLEDNVKVESKDKSTTTKIYEAFGVNEVVTYHLSNLFRQATRTVIPTSASLPGKLFSEGYSCSYLSSKPLKALMGLYYESIRAGVLAAEVMSVDFLSSLTETPVSSSVAVLLSYSVISNLLSPNFNDKGRMAENIYKLEI